MMLTSTLLPLRSENFLAMLALVLVYNLLNGNL
jgi:hypothetical protein